MVRFFDRVTKVKPVCLRTRSDLIVDIGVIEDGAVRLWLDVSSTITRKTMVPIEAARGARLRNPRSSDLTLQRDRLGSRTTALNTPIVTSFSIGAGVRDSEGVLDAS